MQSEHLEKLWSEYCCRLLAFIRARVPDETEAEDILQEVFLRLHESLCCSEAVTHMEAWIYRVTRNLIIDHYRARRPAEELPETIPAPPAAEEDPRTRLAFSLMETIQELPARYRDALIMTEYHGMSQQQLADAAGITLSGAKSRVQRARDRLRRLLLDCCHFELDRQGRIIDYRARCCRCNPVGTSGAAESMPTGTPCL
jgi:RNA polymerase sigma-70 factor, ECF subfamily